MTRQEFASKAGGQVPWNRGKWSGQLLTFDDTSTTDFGKNDIAKVLAVNNTGDGWDGTGAAVVQLKDGRWVTWESMWGPTGDGFSEDAYGGDTNIFFASSIEYAICYGLTDEGRRILGLNIEDWSDPHATLPELEDITDA